MPREHEPGTRGTEFEGHIARRNWLVDERDLEGCTEAMTYF